MAAIVVLAGSPSANSRTVALTEHIAARLREHGHRVRTVRVRDLPAEALLSADASEPRIAEVLDAIAAAEGVVVASPVYKAAYSGVLKTLLDLLPQCLYRPPEGGPPPPVALTDKVVLPVVTGGSPARVLALDYALRPVLSSLGAHHIVQGWFVLDRHIEATEVGDVLLAPESAQPLYGVVDGFSAALHARRALAAAS
jgi:FMN reductase